MGIQIKENYALLVKKISEFANKSKARELLIIVAALLVCFFIFYPDIFLKREIMTPADFIFLWEPWSSLIPNHVASNYVLSDLVEAYYPAQSYLISQIKNGDLLPLWSNSQGLGAASGLAFLANNLVNPLTIIPALLFSYPQAITYFAIIKYLLGGVFMYLLLRRYNLSKLSALFGTIVFSLGLYNVVWMMTGLHQVSISIPIILYSVELLIEKYSKKRLLLFIFACALLIFGGFISNIGYISYMLVFYVGIRLIAIYKTNKDWKFAINKIAVFAFGGLVTLGLLSFTLVPTYKYLTKNVDISYREKTHAKRVISRDFVMRYIVPEYLGNPIKYNWQQAPILARPSTNYNESAMYIGLLPMILVLFSIPSIKKDYKVLFYWAIAIISTLVIFDVSIFLDVVSKFPIFNTNPSARLFVLVSFSLSVLSAYGLNTLLRHNKEIPKYSYKFVLVLFTCIFALIIYRISSLTNGLSGMSHRITTELLFTLTYFFGSMIYLSFFFSKKKALTLLAVGVIAISFLDLYRVGANYNPTIKESNFYPKTKGIQYLLENSDLDRLLAYEEVLLFGGPTYYGLNPLTLTTHYDSRWVEFINYIQPNSIGLQRKTVRFYRADLDLDNQLLDLVGVKHIVDHGDAEALEVKPIYHNDESNSTIELAKDSVVKQTIVPNESLPLEALSLPLDSVNIVDPQPLVFSVVKEDIAIASVEIEAGSLQAGLNEVKLDSSLLQEGQNYTVIFQWKGASNNLAVFRSSQEVDLYRRGSISLNDTAINGDLTFTLLSSSPELNKSYKKVYDSEITIFENTEAFKKTFLINDIVVAKNENEALKHLKELEKSKELNKVAVLEGVHGNTDIDSKISCMTNQFSNSKVKEYKSTYVRVETNTDCQSLLVLSDLYNEDWSVYVNGEKSQLYRTDYLLRGVIVPKGNNTIEFKYELKSFDLGVTISSVTAATLILYFLVSNKKLQSSVKKVLSRD